MDYFDIDVYSRAISTKSADAQLWFDRQLSRPEVPMGTEPTDTFQQKAEPYVPWATTEYIFIDGSDRLGVEPLTLNAPYPCTRTGFCKATFLVKARSGCDYDAFFSHWLSAHSENVMNTAVAAGAFSILVERVVMRGDDRDGARVDEGRRR